MARKADKLLLQYLTSLTWTMHEPVLARLVDVIDRHACGVKLTEKEITDALAASGKETPQPPREYRVDRSTAIVPIFGVIAKHANQVNDVSQPTGTSVEHIRENIARALGDRKAASVMLHIESPGGSADGVAELADEILAASRQKPMGAFIDGIGASGAYWLASQAGRIFASRSSIVGSIGVYGVLRDSSKAAEDAGVRYVVVRAGRFKGVGVPGTPINKGDLEDIQSEIDATYELFLADVARGRGRDVEQIRKSAEGRVFLGRKAIDAGLIDAVASYDKALELVGATPLRSVVAMGTSASAAEAASESEQTADTPGGLGPQAEQENLEPGKEPQTMSESTKTEPKAPAADAAAQIQQQVAAATAAENARCAAVAKVLVGHSDLMEKALADTSCDASKAQAMLLPKVQEQLTKAQADLAEANKRLDAIAAAGGKPVAQAAADQGKTDPAPKAEKAEETTATYASRIEELVKAGAKTSEARLQAARDFPDEHAAWVAEQNKKVR
jgi:signal peptide peptidase SppA